MQNNVIFGVRRAFGRRQGVKDVSTKNITNALNCNKRLDLKRS
jgi:hypothetical protein